MSSTSDQSISDSLSQTMDNNNNNKKSLQSIKSVDEFDLGKLQLIRGDSPDNVQQQCLEFCKDYLAANWCQQTVDTIEFKRLSGGLTNQLYYISIAKPLTTSPAPQEVIIRLYGPKHFGDDQRLTDVVIALMVSQLNLGPKIYGVSESGQLMHFYKHRQFRQSEQNNPKLSTKLFEKLAKLHTLDVPVKRNTNWINDYLDTFYDIAFKTYPINELINEYNLITLKTNDLKDEINWLKRTLSESQSPIVFTHIDFRGSNIMITEPNDEIILCDLEYSGYGYRGFDFGTIFVEWGRGFGDYNAVYNFPDESVLEPLLMAYLNKTKLILGDKCLDHKIHSYQQLLKETKVFVLAAFMWLVMFCIRNDEDNGFPVNKQVMMGMAEINYKNYFKVKKIFSQQNIF